MNLAGIHDFAGVAISPERTWLVDTISLSENQRPRNYNTEAPGRNIIGRLNWGYGSTGTLPLEENYPTYVQKVADHVAQSAGCSRWIIGNETNLPREWPHREGVPQPIHPTKYAEVYRQCRRAIRALPGHQNDEVLVAAPGPWNDQYRYAGNDKGDWIVYFTDVLRFLGQECDGISIHAYTHGYDVSRVTSNTMMGSPFTDRYYDFRTYRDFMAAIPSVLRRVPVYLTECNGNGPWQAVGLMPAMLEEIAEWNRTQAQPILCVCFYRYTTDDTFNIVGKGDVVAEYQAAVARNYFSPVVSIALPPAAPVHVAPPVVAGQGDVPMAMQRTGPALIWDSRLDQRKIKRTEYQPKPGELYWKLVKGEYWLEKEHIFIDVLGLDGEKLAGIQARRWWGGGSASEQDFDTTEITPDRWMANFPMWNPGWSYGLEVLGHPSDTLWGMGLGTWEDPEWKIHLSYKFTFRLVQAPLEQPVPKPTKPDPLTPKPVEVPVPSSGARLIWPCKGVIFQRWGEDPEDYQKELKIPYHNGTDIAAPAGTEVRAMADGVIAFVGVDQKYGNYIREWHEQLGLHTFLAHLLTVDVAAGQRVVQGQVIGKVGSTGNSTGPHCHVEVRLGAKDEYAQGTFGHSSGRVDPETVMYVLNHAVGLTGLVSNAHGFDIAAAGPAAPTVGKSVPKETLVKLAEGAAQEFGVDVPLFLRLVEYESSWRVDVVSSAGAVGLAQLMPNTFSEEAVKVNATNILSPRDNLRVGASYLASLVKYYQGNLELAVTAYNMGLGNVDAGVEPSADTKAYVRKVVYNVE